MIRRAAILFWFLAEFRAPCLPPSCLLLKRFLNDQLCVRTWRSLPSACFAWNDGHGLFGCGNRHCQYGGNSRYVGIGSGVHLRRWRDSDQRGKLRDPDACFKHDTCIDRIRRYADRRYRLNAGWVFPERHHHVYRTIGGYSMSHYGATGTRARRGLHVNYRQPGKSELLGNPGAILLLPDGTSERGRPGHGAVPGQHWGECGMPARICDLRCQLWRNVSGVRGSRRIGSIVCHEGVDHQWINGNDFKSADNSLQQHGFNNICRGVACAHDGRWFPERVRGHAKPGSSRDRDEFIRYRGDHYGLDNYQQTAQAAGSTAGQSVRAVK